MLTYSEEDLVSQLRSLPTERKVAFALGCAQRTLAYYGYPVRQSCPNLLLDAVEQVIRSCGHVQGGTAEIPDAVKACEDTLDPDDDAVATILYAARCPATGDPREAACAARRAYEVRDRQVSDHLGIDFGTQTPRNASSIIQVFN